MLYFILSIKFYRIINIYIINMKKDNNKKNNITPFEKDIGKWYLDIILKSELISHAPVKGTMFFKPYGYSIWKKIEEIFTKEFKKLDIQEVKFPLLFPMNLLKKEKDHIEGFVPEVFIVTKVGEKDLNENYVIRPTSEILFGVYFKEELKTYRQLPLKLNQWVNVLRWEKNTKPFLRNSEFFWQEGHTVHKDEKEANLFSLKMIDLYENIVKKVLLIPVLKGEKSVSETFAGAKKTYTIETILKDGQVLQSGTSHYLGDKFGKAFNLKVQDENNNYIIPFQTSWGVSTRLIGALIMTHSDDKGLILPSKLSPYKVVLIKIGKEDLIDQKIYEIDKKINTKSYIDLEDKGLGYKLQNWEVKGVPILIVIGKKELEENFATIIVRNKQEKIKVNVNEIDKNLIKNILIDYDKKIFSDANKLKNAKIVEISSKDELEKNIRLGKVCKVYLIDNIEFEKEIKEKFGATVRLIVDSNKEGKCINSNKKTNKIAYIGRSY